MAKKAHEKMLNVTNYYRNANQNYKEVSPHTSQNGHHQNGVDVEKRQPLYTVGGNVTWCSHYGKQYADCSKN